MYSRCLEDTCFRINTWITQWGYDQQRQWFCITLWRWLTLAWRLQFWGKGGWPEQECTILQNKQLDARVSSSGIKVTGDWKNNVCHVVLASHFFLWENDKVKINPFNHVMKNHICHVFLASHFFLWENDQVKMNPFNDVWRTTPVWNPQKVLISSLWEIKTVQIICLQMTWRTTSAWSVSLNHKKSKSGH